MNTILNSPPTHNPNMGYSVFLISSERTSPKIFLSPNEYNCLTHLLVGAGWKHWSHASSSSFWMLFRTIHSACWMVSSQNTRQINFFLSISSHFCSALEIRTPNIIPHLCFNHVIHCPWSQCKHGCLRECAIQNSFSGLQSIFQYLCLFLLSFLLTLFLSLIITQWHWI